MAKNLKCPIKVNLLILKWIGKERFIKKMEYSGRLVIGDREKKLVFLNANFYEISVALGNTDFITYNNWGIVMTPVLVDDFNTIFWGKWQSLLKLTTAINQVYTCPICKKPLGWSELHHSLITRADVRGIKKSNKPFIHHTFNVLELCKKCHEKINREQSLNALSEMYGYDKVLEWYNTESEKYLKTKIRNLEIFNGKECNS